MPKQNWYSNVFYTENVWVKRTDSHRFSCTYVNYYEVKEGGVISNGIE